LTHTKAKYQSLGKKKDGKIIIKAQIHLRIKELVTSGIGSKPKRAKSQVMMGSLISHH
jgi:hypothetical protein